MSNVIVFDLDGVITSEEAYWVSAGLVLHEFLYSPRYWNIHGADIYHLPESTEEYERLSKAVLPRSIMLSFKAHAINSNWDTCHAAVCICLIHLLGLLPDRTTLLPLRPWDSEWLGAFREALSHRSEETVVDEESYHRILDTPAVCGYVGLELFERLNAYAGELLGQPVEGVFGRDSALWTLGQDIFQEWYLGDELYRQEHHHEPAQMGKTGCIHMEKPLLPVERLRATLETLREQGYTLGIATGRPGSEAIVPLKNYGLFEYFDPARAVTHAEVTVTEAKLRAQGDNTALVKPHPYQFMAAYDPHYELGQPLPSRGSFIVVGDTTSDVRGGHAANAIVIAVLSGALTEESRTLLERSQPDFLVEDVTRVPEVLQRLDDLSTIQRMQFIEREKAEMLLRRWFYKYMDLTVEQVTLMPRPVSLNSFNGMYRVGREEYFFKTHVEDQGVLEEYYHAEFLYNAGYNIVRPLQTIHQKGQQMVIYPVIHSPVMFDLMREVETGDTLRATVEMLATAERCECERLLSIYQETFADSTAEEHAQAPIHQLFWHRLTGGRLQSFYTEKFFPFPDASRQQNRGEGLSFEELQTYRWIINGEEIAGNYPTLGEMIQRAMVVLKPERAVKTVIGHGDAHFGNVFLENQTAYRYFDPAFAGRHAPILDIVKPFFHNVFATWMYFPQDVARDLQMSVSLQGSRIIVEHNYELTPVRKAILETKVTYLLHPLLDILRSHDALPDDWTEMMHLALMCCPLLTVNLLDTSKRPAEICWLGLTQVMQMGHLELIGGF